MNVQHSSETDEHFTPPDIVEAAREVLGVIELDPASCELANQTIQASRIFTKEENGLLQRWTGRVFVNPPGGLVDDKGQVVIRSGKGELGCTISGSCGLKPGHTHSGVTSSAKAWWRKLARSWMQYDIEGAIFVGFSIEILQSTQRRKRQKGEQQELEPEHRVPVPMDFPYCIPEGRLRFLSEQYGALLPGTSPTHASCLIYLPPRFDPRGERFARVFEKFGMVRT